MQAGNRISHRRLSSGLDPGLGRNRLLLGGIGLEIFFSWALLYWPPIQRLLGTRPVPWQIYTLCWLGPLLLIGFDTIRKQVVVNRMKALR